MRVQTNQSHIDQLALDLKEDPDLEMPPVMVFLDAEGTRWLAAGFHRLPAYRLAGREWIPVKIKEGGLRDAILFAMSDNHAHGLRRTNDDKAKAVHTALADGEWSQWSDREIGRLCKVTGEMVGEARRKMNQEGASGATLSDSDSCQPGAVYRNYKDKKGNVRTMNVSNIGKKKKKTEAEEPEEKAAPDWENVFQAARHALETWQVYDRSGKEIDRKHALALTEEALIKMDAMDKYVNA